jgi:hypothetical protein
MRVKILFRSLILLVSSALIFSSCSDDSPSGEPPSIPNLSETRPTFDYFDQNAKVALQTGENFQLASSLASSMEIIMTSFSSVPESFLGLVSEDDPSFDNGVWTWERSESSIQGESFSVRLEAEQTNTRVNWVMFISADTQEQTFDNYKVFDGFVLTEGNEGEWNIYAFEENANVSGPIMTYDWTIESESVASFNFTFNDSDVSSLGFTKNSPDNTITIVNSNGSTMIYWNSTDGSGYIDQAGEDRVCWDSSSNNTPCTGA